MSSELTKAQAERVVNLSTYCQRLAAYLNIDAIELLDALDVCNLTLDKDSKDVVTDHKDLITWVPHRGTAT